MTNADEQDQAAGISEVAERVGLNPDTIRYYERHGVLPPPHRDAGGRRSYDSGAVHLIEVLLHLRDTGMPLARITEFTHLVARDPAGVDERLALLKDHRAEVAKRIRTWTKSLHVIDQKITDYQARADNDE
ncbi:DNA-binding transcriptional MerR regulator [Nakamurella sp. UYEF19]|uniref:MerR family transcriptional regulator n=1 Tax=Nakamurella sp. UYEF19 TaxID=1756392 RepID=UPI0033944400